MIYLGIHENHFATEPVNTPKKKKEWKQNYTYAECTCQTPWVPAQKKKPQATAASTR